MDSDSIRLAAGINEEMENRLIAKCSPFIDALHKTDPYRYSIIADNQLAGLISADKDWLGGKFIGYYEQNLCFRLPTSEALQYRTI